MREYISALEALKRSTESFGEALRNYADALDPQAPTDEDILSTALTADEVDEWLKRK